MIEVGEAKKGAYFFDFGGCWPDGNTVKFDWVHGKLTRFPIIPRYSTLGMSNWHFLSLRWRSSSVMH